MKTVLLSLFVTTLAYSTQEERILRSPSPRNQKMAPIREKVKTATSLSTKNGDKTKTTRQEVVQFAQKTSTIVDRLKNAKRRLAVVNQLQEDVLNALQVLETQQTHCEQLLELLEQRVRELNADLQ